MASRSPGRLDGYQPLPGTARRYRTPSGEIISRYEYDSRRLRTAGWKNRGQFERARRSQTWQKAMKLARQATGSVERNAMAQAMDPYMRDAYEVERRRALLGYDILGNRVPDRTDPWLVDPDGPLAGLLVAMGRRDIGDRWAVGDSPKGIRR